MRHVTATGSLRSAPPSSDVSDRQGLVVTRQAASPLGAVLLLHAVAGAGFVACALQHQASGMSLGAGLLAYSLGARHAFDADHITAIDNVTRHLYGQVPRASLVGVGTWFALGHSTIVVGLCLALAFGAQHARAQLDAPGSLLHQVSSWIGPGVSGVFLLVVGVVNLRALVGLLRLRRVGQNLGVERVETWLQRRGVVARCVGPVAARVRRPRGMFVVGLCFGLGFDTASEIGLLGLTSGRARLGAGVWLLVWLPVCFAAAMSAGDSVDAVVMVRACAWSREDVAGGVGRGLRYALVTTGMSVAAAVLVAGVELMGLTPLGPRVDRWAGPVVTPLGWVLVVGLFGVGVVAWRGGRRPQEV